MDLEIEKCGDSRRKLLTCWNYALGIQDRVTGALKFVIGFGITTQREAVIKMCLKESCSKVRTGRFSFTWTVRNFGEIRVFWNNSNTQTSSSKRRFQITKFNEISLNLNTYIIFYDSHYFVYDSDCTVSSVIYLVT